MGFPITGKLNPFASLRPFRLNVGNLAYMAEAAVLTRMLTSAVRVLQYTPDKQKDPHLTINDKRQTLLERVFIEFVGTPGYIFLLHLGQDLGSKFLEAKNHLPDIPKSVSGLNTAELNQIRDAFKVVFGEQKQGMVHRVLYGEKVLKDGATQLQKANMATLRKALGPELFEKMRQHLPQIEGFAKRSNRMAALSILTGVAVAAFYGGAVTQWLNDKVFGPVIKKMLKARYGEAAVVHPAPVVADDGNTIAVSQAEEMSPAAPVIPAVPNGPNPTFRATPRENPTASYMINAARVNPLMPVGER